VQPYFYSKSYTFSSSTTPQGTVYSSWTSEKGTDKELDEKFEMASDIKGKHKHKYVGKNVQGKDKYDVKENDRKEHLYSKNTIIDLLKKMTEDLYSMTKRHLPTVAAAASSPVVGNSKKQSSSRTKSVRLSKRKNTSSSSRSTVKAI